VCAFPPSHGRPVRLAHTFACRKDATRTHIRMTKMSLAHLHTHSHAAKMRLAHTFAWKRCDLHTHSHGKDATCTHICMEKMRLAHTFARQRCDSHTRTHIRMTKMPLAHLHTHSHAAKMRLALAVSYHSQFHTRSLIFGLFLEMDTCLVKIVVVSTRVDEQLISILCHSEERRKCLEPSNVFAFSCY